MDHIEFQRQMRVQRLSDTAAMFHYVALLAFALGTALLIAMPTYGYLQSVSAHLQTALSVLPQAR